MTILFLLCRSHNQYYTAYFFVRYGFRMLLFAALHVVSTNYTSGAAHCADLRHTHIPIQHTACVYNNMHCSLAAAVSDLKCCLFSTNSPYLKWIINISVNPVHVLYLWMVNFLPFASVVLFSISSAILDL